MLQVHDFAYGLVTPALGYVAACLGALLGLRCATRARACRGSARARWLLLAGFAVGGIGIWAMNFVGLLGFAVAGETSRYSVPVTIASLLVAVVTVSTGLLVVGSSGEESGPLIAGGLIAGLGVALAQYLGMAALRPPGRLSYDPALFMISMAMAIMAATAMLWAAARLRRVWATLGASLVLGMAASGTHYTGMAAMRMYPASGAAGMVMGSASGATAESFLLPLILGISIAAFVVTAAITWSPSADEVRYDAALLDRIRKHGEQPLSAGTVAVRPYHHASAEPPPWTLIDLRMPPGLR